MRKFGINISEEADVDQKTLDRNFTYHPPKGDQAEHLYLRGSVPFMRKSFYRRCMRCNRYEDHGNEKSPSAGTNGLYREKPTL